MPGDLLAYEEDTMKPGDNSVLLPAWRKSTRSQMDCVELATLTGAIGVRDSKDEQAVLAFDRRQWLRFVDRIVSGELDLH